MGRVRSKTRRMSYVSTVNRQQRQSYVIRHVTFETLKLEPYIVTTVCPFFELEVHNKEVVRRENNLFYIIYLARGS